MDENKNNNEQEKLPYGIEPETKKKSDGDNGNYMSAGMCVGLAIGGIIGDRFFKDYTMGIIMGMCVGMGIGSLISLIKKK